MPGYFLNLNTVPRGGWQATPWRQAPAIGYGYGSMNPAWQPDFFLRANAAPAAYAIPRYASGESAIPSQWPMSGVGANYACNLR